MQRRQKAQRKPQSERKKEVLKPKQRSHSRRTQNSMYGWHCPGLWSCTGWHFGPCGAPPPHHCVDRVRFPAGGPWAHPEVLHCFFFFVLEPAATAAVRLVGSAPLPVEGRGPGQGSLYSSWAPQPWCSRSPRLGDATFLKGVNRNCPERWLCAHCSASCLVATRWPCRAERGDDVALFLLPCSSRTWSAPAEGPGVCVSRTTSAMGHFKAEMRRTAGSDAACERTLSLPAPGGLQPPGSRTGP